MEKLNSWLGVATNIGMIAGLLLVGIELKQNREIAVASAYDARTAGWRDMNYARMNADWYWETAAKLNDQLGESELRLGIPVSNTETWTKALETLSAEERGRFSSFHLQEKNEVERLHNLYGLGLITEEDWAQADAVVRMRAPLWTALFRLGNSRFDLLVIENAERTPSE